MPSNKDPSVVQPGPGKLAAGQVPASALAFPFSGSGDLAAHIGDPIDAHMASAIGVPETDPNTGQPLLGSAGGPYDGESVSDALTALAQLFPVKPDKLGFNAAVPNSGIPDWGTALGSLAEHGGWTDGGTGIVTKYVSPTVVTSSPLTGMVYPADRGVLALYSTTDGDFFNAPQTTLVAALWLGQNPPPPGMPGAGFSELTRATGQTDYTATLAGLDLISLADRLPYFNYYPGFEYTPFGQNFNAYQLGRYTVGVPLPGGGDAESFLLVHWREQYANTLTAIQPANLTALTFVAANLYSASVDPEYQNVERLNVYQSPMSAPAPVGTVAITPAGTLTTQKLSGLDFYSSTSFALDVLGTCNGLFDGYYTNTVASVSVPAGFESPYPIVEGDLSQFGAANVSYQLYDDGTPNILNHATGLPYSLVSPPQISHTARLSETGRLVSGASRFTYWEFSKFYAIWKNPGVAAVTQASDLDIMFNTWDQATALADNKQTKTQDHFVQEHYRYVSTHTAAASAVPIIPTGGNDFDSTVKLVASGPDLQVISGRLQYPGGPNGVNYDGSAVRPVQTLGSDYFTSVASADPSPHKRRWVRAFNTGIARNTGKIRIKINQPGPQTNLFLASFAGGPVIDPAEITDHTGGMILQIKVPGQSGWLDLGRANGVPDLVKSNDFRGCRTSVTGDGTPEMIFSYDSQYFTTDNGDGDYLLFVRATIIKPAGTNLYIDEIEWLPP